MKKDKLNEIVKTIEQSESMDIKTIKVLKNRTKKIESGVFKVCFIGSEKQVQPKCSKI